MFRERVAQLIATFFADRGKDIPASDYELFDNQLIDSMELVELIMQLEQDLGVELDQDLMTVDNFRTVDAMLKTITKSQH